MRVAAVQLQPAIADIDANLEASGRLVAAAVRDGAELIALPEFFTTGATFDPRLADASLPPDGAATQFLQANAREHGITIGGSFLCRDADGEVRNAYLLVDPSGTVLGRHDKDLPTMWENALYVGGAPGDDGVISAGDFTAGAAVCWEFMRSGTARRLRARVDVVIGGSNWWSVPSWPPRAITRRWAVANENHAWRAPSVFGRYVGAPVVHANMCGPIECSMPDMPGVTYRGRFVGGALIANERGEVLAARAAVDGPGHVVADARFRPPDTVKNGVRPRFSPLDDVPDSYWLHRRGPLPAWSWQSQRIVGRRWYRRHVRRAA